MKLIKTIIYAFFKIFPDRFIFCVIKIILKFKKYHGFKINHHIAKSTRDLIYLDYIGAIGDFTILLRNLIDISEKRCEYDVLVNIKFKGIIEKLGLNNLNVIYKTNSTGNHYAINEKANFNEIFFESSNMKVNYNNIYYFNKELRLDAVLFLLGINYNKLIKMKNIYKHAPRKTFWLQKEDINLSLYTYLLKDKLKIEQIGNKKQRSLFLSDYAYYIMHGQLPNDSLMNLTTNAFEEFVQEKSVIIMFDKLPRSKILKTNEIISVLLEKFHDFKIICVGTGEKHFNEFVTLSNNHLNIINYVNKTNSILDLFKIIANASHIFAFDTCILHIGMLFGKNTILFCNKSSRIYKYEFNVWMNYSSQPNFAIHILNNRHFLNN